MSKSTRNLEDIIVFEDINLKNKILESLGKGSGEEVTVQEIQTLNQILAPESNITSLVGLEHATNITRLNVSSNKISNLEPIKDLVKLTSIFIDGNEITDLLMLSNLVNLEAIWAKGNEISSLEGIENCTKLVNLNMEETNITNIDVVSNFPNLETLSLNYIKTDSIDLQPVSNCTKLKYLYLLDIVNVKNLEVISCLKSLENLYVQGYQIKESELALLPNIPNLAMISIGKGGLTSVESLKGLKNCSNLTYVILPGNSITDLSPLNELKEKGVKVSAKNQVISLEPKEIIAGQLEMDNFLVNFDGTKVAPKELTCENDVIKWESVNPSINELSFEFETPEFTGIVTFPVTHKAIEIEKEGCVGEVKVQTNNNFQTFLNIEITEQLDHLGRGDVIEINWMDKDGNSLKKINSLWTKFLTPVNADDVIGNNPTGGKVGFGDVIPAGFYAISYINQKIAKVSITVINKPSEEIEGDKDGDGVIADNEVLVSVVQAEVCENIAVSITENGNAYACGNNLHGQLGVGRMRSTQVYEPTRVPVKGVKQVVTSGLHSFYIAEDGIYACGRNYEGQLGLGHTHDVFEPVKVDIEGVKEIVCSKYNTFFIMEDKTVKCCGMNACGELGVGHLDLVKEITDVIGIKKVKSIKTDNRTTLFNLENGDVYGCGDNGYGQLGTGNGNKTYETTPIKVRFKMK